MALTVKYTHLSAFAPIELSYSLNGRNEKMYSETNTFANGFSFTRHTALSGYKDAALSKDTCLILTDIKKITDVLDFSTSVSSGSIGVYLSNISFYLLAQNKETIKTYNRKVYAGGIGEDLSIGLVSISPNLVELKLNTEDYLRVNQTYPYDLYVSNEELDPQDYQEKRFEIDFWQGKITFKCLTPEGYRYLSYGTDKQIRAVGLELNELIVNPYSFEPIFISDVQTMDGINQSLDACEVYYFNELNGNNDYINLSVKQKLENETSLLLTCSLGDLRKASKVSTNIALLKNNFTASGSYTTK